MRRIEYTEMIAVTVGKLRQSVFKAAECFFFNEIIYPKSIHSTHQVLVPNKGTFFAAAV